MKNKTILIVDDTPSNIDIAVEILHEYDIVDALSASEAFKILEIEKIDLILLDIVMPEMDGYKMCTILKSDNKTANIPVIFLSSNNSEEEIAKGFELGAVDYVTKPFHKSELKSRIKIHLELFEYREQLEQKIELEKRKSKDKDEILFYQSKLVSMGEMIQNIAHQWRQPLSQINSNVMLIELALHQKSGVDKDTIENQMNEIESLTKYMSDTINDFQNFFSKDKQKEHFRMNKAISNALEILKGTLTHFKIEIGFTIDEEILIYSHKNEIQQVILVILNNAKDALIFKKTKEPKIDIELTKNEDNIVLCISDNAGGIEKENIYKVFEPYYTTKHQSQGTGLGLYISKMIIEESLNGNIYVENGDKGACFKVVLKET